MQVMYNFMHINLGVDIFAAQYNMLALFEVSVFIGPELQLGGGIGESFPKNLRMGRVR